MPSTSPATTSRSSGSCSTGWKRRACCTVSAAAVRRAGAHQPEVGRIQTTRGGAGFLLPEDRSPDVFIPVEGAEHGHRRRPGRGAGGEPQAADRPQGRVIRVLERARTHGGRRVPRRMRPGRGRVRHTASSCRGSQAAVGRVRDARPAPEPEEGDLVVVRITDWGSGHRGPAGEVEEVLGRRARRASMSSPSSGPTSCPRLPGGRRGGGGGAPRAGVTPDDLAGREDLRELIVFTIDPADARDHDDALSIEPVDGGWRVGCTSPMSATTWRRAASSMRRRSARGTSVYLVDRVVPMLPHALSSDLCSLVPGRGPPDAVAVRRPGPRRLAARHRLVRASSGAVPAGLRGGAGRAGRRQRIDEPTDAAHAGSWRVAAAAAQPAARSAAASTSTCRRPGSSSMSAASPRTSSGSSGSRRTGWSRTSCSWPTRSSRGAPCRPGCRSSTGARAARRRADGAAARVRRHARAPAGREGRRAVPEGPAAAAGFGRRRPAGGGPRLDGRAALDEAGPLQRAEPRPLRPRCPGLHALHLADPAVPRPRRAPDRAGSSSTAPRTWLGTERLADIAACQRAGAPRGRRRARQQGPEEGRVHAAPRGRRVRWHDLVRHGVRLLRAARRRSSSRGSCTSAPSRTTTTSSWRRSMPSSASGHAAASGPETASGSRSRGGHRAAPHRVPAGGAACAQRRLGAAGGAEPGAA
jgi:hypothetical protein